MTTPSSFLTNRKLSLSQSLLVARLFCLYVSTYLSIFLSLSILIHLIYACVHRFFLPSTVSMSSSGSADVEGLIWTHQRRQHRWLGRPGWRTERHFPSDINAAMLSTMPTRTSSVASVCLVLLTDLSRKAFSLNSLIYAVARQIREQQYEQRCCCCPCCCCCCCCCCPLLLLPLPLLRPLLLPLILTPLPSCFNCISDHRNMIYRYMLQLNT